MTAPTSQRFMPFRLLLDEMLSGEIAAQLRSKGHDVIAVVEDSALTGTSDEELLAHATSSRRCLVTANVRDFAPIAAYWSSRGRSHSGLVYVVNRAFPNDRSLVGALVTALDDLLRSGEVPVDGGESYLRRHA
jgi:predicted nuclease of predicted toxin-antitoxin system